MPAPLRDDLPQLIEMEADQPSTWIPVLTGRSMPSWLSYWLVTGFTRWLKPELI